MQTITDVAAALLERLVPVPRFPSVKKSCRRAAGLLALAIGVTCVQAPALSAAGRHKGRAVVNGRRAAEGELLVRFSRISSTAGDPDLSDEPIGKRGWRLVRSKSRTAAELLRDMKARGDVAAAEPNYEVSVTGAPNDMAPSLWGLQNTGQTLSNGDRGTAGADIGATAAWDVTTGSRDVVVAVVDTGIMAGHQDLSANVWTAPRSFTVTIGGLTISCPAGSHGFNAIVRSCDPTDDHGHGTHVAGSIGAAGGNAVGVVGVNWTTSIIGMKFLDASGNGYVSDAVDAIDFAIQVRKSLGANIRVINASWNGPDFSQALADELQRANDADMLFVAAAGNSGVDHGTQPSYPASYGAPNVIAVASTDYRDQLSSFSDYGAETVHVAAPGTLIYSTMIVPGDPAGSGYATFSGTSMATAYASGTAALVLANCSYSTGALRNALLSSAKTLPSLVGRVQSGRRIDAAAAVRSCAGASSTTPANIVLYAADVPASGRHGSWSLVQDSSAAGGAALASADNGWSSTTAPLAAPTDYVDLSFNAPANVSYRLWVRLKASGNSKWNDSVWVQYSDALIDGAPAYQLGSASGLALNLENCSGCGVAGWGWQDGVYWLAPPPGFTFSSSGSHTLRIQNREDGVAFDQVLLAAVAGDSAPGQRMGDATILAKAGTPAPAPAAQPYGGTPASVPGTLRSERFDDGGEGIAYHDTSAGNSGGAFRQTDVDLEASSDGGYNVGWVSPGEWLQYSVNVATAGSYTVQFRVAAPIGGGRFHLEAGGSNLTGALTVPTTGDWQTWQTVTSTVALAAGPQALRIVFDTASSGMVGNFGSIAIASAVSASPSGGTALPGTIAAADFDAGGEGVSFHDATSGNSGGAYRQTDVDIEACSEGGYDVGWISPGEWLNYGVNVAVAGQYTVRLRMASPAGGGMHVNFIGATGLSAAVSVPATGDWQNWTSVSVPVTLAAGTQTLRLLFDTGGYNISRIDVSKP